jgi:hypothetical protein
MSDPTDGHHLVNQKRQEKNKPFIDALPGGVPCPSSSVFIADRIGKMPDPEGVGVDDMAG